MSIIVVSSSSKNWTDKNVSIDIPKTCPYCGRMVTPHILSSYLNRNDNMDRLSFTSFFVCNACSETFAAQYFLHLGSEGYRGSFKKTIPTQYTETFKIDSRIADISPRYAALSEDSDVALSHGLTDLAGMGYRKALECLLKDSLIYKYPDSDKNDIIRLSLFDTIARFKDINPDLVKVANQARVIGNEYTHYDTKYESYDITDLKNLIQISSHWLLIALVTDSISPLPPKSRF